MVTTNKKVNTSNTSTKKNKTTTITTLRQDLAPPTVVLPDYVSYLVALDVKWYLYLKDAVRQAQDSYLVVADVIEKNKEKVENPKGDSAANGMSMF